MIYFGSFSFRKDCKDEKNFEGRFNLIVSAKDIAEADKKFKKKLLETKKTDFGGALDGITDIYMDSILAIKNPMEPIMANFVEGHRTEDSHCSICCVCPESSPQIIAYGSTDPEKDDGVMDPYVTLKQAKKGNVNVYSTSRKPA
jgi:hypothetical protein